MVISLLKAIIQNVAFKKELLKDLAHCLVRGTEQNNKNVTMLNKWYIIFAEIGRFLFQLLDELLFKEHLTFNSMHLDEQKMYFNLKIHDCVQIVTFFCKLSSLFLLDCIKKGSKLKNISYE